MNHTEDIKDTAVNGRPTGSINDGGDWSKKKITMEQVLGKSCTKEEALNVLRQNQECYNKFLHYNTDAQNKLLKFLMGEQSLLITYNSFFLTIFNPDIHKDRLEKLLSVLLNQKVHIKQILPSEGNRLADEGSLVIMDIICELEDGSIIDVEMQKIGYDFPGERSCCYTADMIMRQYNRLRSKVDKDSRKIFSYRDMKPVYLIILMENSPSEFHKYTGTYIHRRRTEYDSGMKIVDLANVVYICLDMFHDTVQNIGTELDAWMTFLSCSEADSILNLVQKYPEFMQYYHEIAEFR